MYSHSKLEEFNYNESTCEDITENNIGIPIFEEFKYDDFVIANLKEKLHYNNCSFVYEQRDAENRSLLYTYLGVKIESKIFSFEKDEEHKENPFEYLQMYLNKFILKRNSILPPFQGGALAFFGNDSIQYYENLNLISYMDKEYPDVGILEIETFISVDHVKKKCFLIKVIDEKESANKAHKEELKDVLEKLLSNEKKEKKMGKVNEDYLNNHQVWNYQLSKEEFKQGVESIQNYIKAGDIFQAVYSIKIDKNLIACPFSIYKELTLGNPSPTSFYIKVNNFCIFGSSPLKFVKKVGDKITSEVDAGTRSIKREGFTKKEIEIELLSSEKDKAEHIMLVDLARNDLGRVAKPNSINVSSLMTIKSFSHVMHIFSEIEGDASKNSTSTDIIKSFFPGGPVTGAPKIRAIEIISKIENSSRGPYGGITGLFGFDGYIDSTVIIRSLWTDYKKLYLQVGAGIVADSNPEEEYFECINKAQALFDSVSVAEKKLLNLNI